MFAICTLFILAACGGGGSETPTAAPRACVPKPVVTIQLFGDSTMLGSGATDPTWTPDALLQAALDARFGKGAALVFNFARGGTTAGDALNGTRDMAVWPADVRSDIVVVNWGVNDASTGVPLESYRDQLRRLSKVTIFETPNPIVPGLGDDSAYAKVMREVAAERGLPVADTQAYVLTIQNWQLLFSDGYHHPNDALYRMIVASSLAPAVVAEVAKLRCMS